LSLGGNGATKSLDIEQEEFSDTAAVSAIVAAARRGVTVRVVLESPSDYSSEVSQVTSAGASRRVLGPNGFYIHAKTIIADYGTSGARAFAGSENLSNNSLENNRELGLITPDSASGQTLGRQRRDLLRQRRTGAHRVV
jgi:phosphatidylserine/phosphatidylglycerophosphate/cardiolipin synthase-like enzyme